MADWSGEEYARVSDLQRTAATDAIAELDLAGHEWVLDIGCGDGFLTRSVADKVPDGFVVGIDPSPRMLTTAQSVPASVGSGPRFVRADARRLPLRPRFDMVISFNALHWVPEQREALAEIAAVLRPGGRAVIQMVCATELVSIESITMQVCHSPRWAPWFENFAAPFVHVDPASYPEFAASAGLTTVSIAVTQREWDFGSRQLFSRWCAVGTGAWTDRLSAEDRQEFVDDLVREYEALSHQPGLLRFAQMRTELRK